MKITICSSMVFFRDILAVQRKLVSLGHQVVVPDGVDELEGKSVTEVRDLTGTQSKIAGDLIRQHFEHIKNSDAILVLNYRKNGIANYVGGNTFLEIGFAYILGRSIYMLYGEPDQSTFLDELRAMGPAVLNGDLNALPLELGSTLAAKRAA